MSQGRLKRFFLAYVHEGAWGYLGFLCLGLSLDLLCLPPGPLPFLVLAADAPFLWLLFHRGGKQWKRWAFLYGVLHFGFGLRWLSAVHPVQVVGAAVILGPVYLLLGLAIRGCLRRGAPFVISVGVCVVLEEFVRTFWMGGMPWPARSLSFATAQPLDLGLDCLLPAAAFLGAYAFSFFAGMTSALVFHLRWWRSTDPLRRAFGRRGLSRGGIVPAAFLVVLIGLAWMRTSEVTSGESAAATTRRVLISVQGNISQDLKHSSNPEELRRNFDRHLSISATAIRRHGPGNVLGVLWPETMVSWSFMDADLAHRYPKEWGYEVFVLQRLKDDVPEARDIPWMIGALYWFRRGEERHVDPWDYGQHDSLFLLDPSRAPGLEDDTPRPPAVGETAPWIRGRHDKVKLVPGGEYTPLGEVLPPLRIFRNFVSQIPELDPGDDVQEPFELVDWEGDRSARFKEGMLVRAGTVICFELAFPARCRDWREAGADVLLNAANYGWFDKTGFRSQIQSIARLRAAELGVTVVMAGNTGPTAFYDVLGRTTGHFQIAGRPEEELACGAIGTTFKEGYAWAPLQVDRANPRGPLYARLGDWPWFVLAGLLLAWVLRRRTPANALEGQTT